MKALTAIFFLTCLPFQQGVGRTLPEVGTGRTCPIALCALAAPTALPLAENWLDEEEFDPKEPQSLLNFTGPYADRIAAKSEGVYARLHSIDYFSPPFFIKSPQSPRAPPA